MGLDAASQPARRPKRSETPPARSSPKKASATGPPEAAAAAAGPELKHLNKLVKTIAAVHGGPNGAPAARRAPARRKCWCWKWLCPSPAAFRGAVFLLALTAVVFHHNSGLFDGLANASYALAGVSAAAGNLAGAGANVTVAFSTVGVEIVNTATNAAHEAWQGIDLFNVSIHRTTIKIAGDSGGHIVQWILARDDLPGPVVRFCARQVMLLTKHVPVLEANDDLMLFNGSYIMLHVRTRVRSDGSVAFAAVIQTSVFQAVWVNPGWDILGFLVESELTQIVAQLRSAVASMGSDDAKALAIDDHTLYTDFNLGLGFSVRFYCVLFILFFLVAMFYLRHALGLGLFDLFTSGKCAYMFLSNFIKGELHRFTAPTAQSAAAQSAVAEGVEDGFQLVGEGK